MARNIEIKVCADDLRAVRERARALVGHEPELIEQDDSFFAVPHGRLKLRRFADGSAELIHYLRDDSPAAKASDYVRVAAADADGLALALTRALGSLGRVRKQRWLLLHDAIRIHLDHVEGLGDFVELEVVLRDGQPDGEGITAAEALLHELGLAAAPRIAGAYLDLLAATVRPAGAA